MIQRTESIVARRRLGPGEVIRVDGLVIRAVTIHGQPFVTVSRIPPEVVFERQTDVETTEDHDVE